MIFEALWASSKRGELYLTKGGFLHFHVLKRRNKGQVTIREIISQRPGAGREMLEYLKKLPGVTNIFAKVPADLDANGWYEHMGFVFEGVEHSKRGRKLNCWRLWLKEAPIQDKML